MARSSYLVDDSHCQGNFPSETKGFCQRTHIIIIIIIGAADFYHCVIGIWVEVLLFTTSFNIYTLLDYLAAAILF